MSVHRSLININLFGIEIVIRSFVATSEFGWWLMSVNRVSYWLSIAFQYEHYTKQTDG